MPGESGLPGMLIIICREGKFLLFFFTLLHKRATHTHTHTMHAHACSGVFFMYDLSPMMVQLTEHKKSLAHFLTGVCAIVGGVFTVAGMVDGMLYHSTRALKKKVELGKAS